MGKTVYIAVKTDIISDFMDRTDLNDITLRELITQYTKYLIDKGAVHASILKR